MKKYFIVSFLCAVSVSVSIIPTHAQEKSTLDKLINKEWVYVIPVNGVIKQGWVFSDTIAKEFFVTENYNFKKESPFYLAEQIETEFNPEKVGTAKNGKFIIYHDKRKRDGQYYYKDLSFEILELSEKHLTMKCKNGSVLQFKCK